jgi:hypothetical protein
MIHVEFQFICDRCSEIVSNAAIVDSVERPPTCLLPPGWQYQNRYLLCPACIDEPLKTG